jgi:signal transduction histidine kinase
MPQRRPHASAGCPDDDEARRMFLATAAHELRTPVASLRLMLDLLDEELRRDAPDLAEARQRAAQASALSARIVRLCRDLLDLSRLDAGVPLGVQRVELGEVVVNVLGAIDPGGEHVAFDPAAAGPVWAHADAAGVAQVLRILLDNALRFAPAGRPVTVALSQAGRQVAIAVIDNGPGVAARDRERIFRRFERGSRPAHGGGYGLGLAIGREIAHRMGGELRLASPAAPTRFVLELPAGAAARHAA